MVSENTHESSASIWAFRYLYSRNSWISSVSLFWNLLCIAIRDFIFQLVFCYSILLFLQFGFWGLFSEDRLARWTFVFFESWLWRLLFLLGNHTFQQWIIISQSCFNSLSIFSVSSSLSILFCLWVLQSDKSFWLFNSKSFSLFLKRYSMILSS